VIIIKKHAGNVSEAFNFDQYCKLVYIFDAVDFIFLY